MPAPTTRRERTNNNNHRGGSAQHSRGGGGSRGGRHEIPRDVAISKALSFLLRHGARDQGVELDDGGWANLSDVLAWRRLSNISVTLSEIQALIATNDKQRFALKPDPSYHALPNPRSPGGSSLSTSSSTTTTAINQPTTTTTLDPSAYLIRASQGHSLTTISSEKLLTPLLPSDPATPRLVVHGTYPGPWDSILRSGALKPMGRTHIHFATDLPTALPPLSRDRPLRITDEGGVDVVLSGMRRDATVLVWVDVLGSARRGGVKWWRSENGVVLTEGVGGELGLEWVVWAERRGTGEILYGAKPAGGGAAAVKVDGEGDGGSADAHGQGLVERKMGQLDVGDGDGDGDGGNSDKGNDGTATATAAAAADGRGEESEVKPTPPTTMELKDNWDD